LAQSGGSTREEIVTISKLEHVVLNHGGGTALDGSECIFGHGTMG